MPGLDQSGAKHVANVEALHDTPGPPVVATRGGDGRLLGAAAQECETAWGQGGIPQCQGNGGRIVVAMGRTRGKNESRGEPMDSCRAPVARRDVGEVGGSPPLDPWGTRTTPTYVAEATGSAELGGGMRRRKNSSAPPDGPIDGKTSRMTKINGEDSKPLLFQWSANSSARGPSRPVDTRYGRLRMR